MTSFFKDKIKLSIAFLVIIHLVGIVGMLSPYKSYFEGLTPVNLLVSFVVLMLNHKQLNQRWIVFLISIFLAGFGVEVLGVNTGFPFGEYTYGENLGFKLFNTPLMIGLNWVMLIYCSAGVAQLHNNKFIQAAVAATLMLLYDLNLEPVAIEIGLWSWELVSIPLENYISWFFIAYAMHYALLRFMTVPTNGVAGPLFLIQMVFFAIINFT
jgi:uncharacterized membrane protein